MLIVQLADLNQTPIDFSRLSSQIINEADKLTGARKKQFLVCRSLLAHLLNQYCNTPVLPEIVAYDNNRPKFASIDLPDFNISHSEHFVAVAISLSGKVGLDIELSRQRKNYLAIASNFYSDIENEWLNQQADKLDAFWRLWTLKESALKLYAKGVWQMKSISINIAENSISAPFGEDFYFQYHKLGDVYLSINSTEQISNLQLLS